MAVCDEWKRAASTSAQNLNAMLVPQKMVFMIVLNSQIISGRNNHFRFVLTALTSWLGVVGPPPAAARGTNSISWCFLCLNSIFSAFFGVVEGGGGGGGGGMIASLF